MVKVSFAILIISAVLLLCSCRFNQTDVTSLTNASEPPDIISLTTISDPPAETTHSNGTVFDPVLTNDYDTRTEMLFTAITENNIEVLNFLGGVQEDVQSGVYDFIKEIKFGGYTINSSETADDEGATSPPKTYHVTLTVLESNDERFPVGFNTYEITALDAGYGPFFSPLRRIGDDTNKMKITDMEDSLSRNAAVCYFLTLEMMPFYGRDSTDSLEIPKIDTEAFYSALARFFSHVQVRSLVPSSSADGYNKAAKQIFNIDTDFNDQNIEPLWFGGNMLDAVLVSESDETVVIDYYADSLLLVKAFTVEYHFDTKDGFRFTSIKNLYDSGYAPSKYTT